MSTNKNIKILAFQFFSPFQFLAFHPIETLFKVDVLTCVFCLRNRIFGPPLSRSGCPEARQRTWQPCWPRKDKSAIARFRKNPSVDKL
jgi:hypothetical protein